MLEWAKVHGSNYYGTMRDDLERAGAENKHLLLEIDLQGARQVAQLMPSAMQIFIHPPSFEELERRLRSRATETESQIQTRLETARMELANAGEFQYQVINENLEQCALEILNLFRSHEGQK
jgi:guanylate kinase